MRIKLSFHPHCNELPPPPHSLRSTMEQFVLTAIRHSRVLSVQITSVSASQDSTESGYLHCITALFSAMRLYHSTQVSQKMVLRNRREGHRWRMVPPHQGTECQQQEGGDLIKPRKLPNPVLASHQHRALHQELLFCHRRGLLPRKRTEQQCVLERRQQEQNKQSELALCPPSDLEMKLFARQQTMQVVL
ncbi:uncharacterized protein si:ch211-160o17.6 isoform X2 [Micropterus dolomieu]|uniref:uncharacterized protein si:ch211-160o17.6 isoform X2 n=1 Tax=Micropterus dolomieu TaxID=147949 RepID=UPI001E8E3B49|nr:uncharacterized protein si:ch211-160o17.6 isoform X2 [Micropterus dolomieu]